MVCSTSASSRARIDNSKRDLISLPHRNHRRETARNFPAESCEDGKCALVRFSWSYDCSRLGLRNDALKLSQHAAAATIRGSCPTLTIRKHRGRSVPRVVAVTDRLTLRTVCFCHRPVVGKAGSEWQASCKNARSLIQSIDPPWLPNVVNT